MAACCGDLGRMVSPDLDDVAKELITVVGAAAVAVVAQAGKTGGSASGHAATAERDERQQRKLGSAGNIGRVSESGRVQTIGGRSNNGIEAGPVEPPRHYQVRGNGGSVCPGK